MHGVGFRRVMPEMISAGFLTLLTPLIDSARVTLRARLAERPAAEAAPWLPPAAIEPLLFAGIRPYLERLVTPTLALELNVARLRGQLSGATPAQRYDSYIDLLAQEPYRAALAAEYPALGQLAADRLATWVDVTLELVDRLSHDWAGIRQTIFEGTDPGPVAQVCFPQRTTKRGGRAVVALTFASGVKLVYKPRSLAVEAHFQTLLAWLNNVGFAPPYTPLRLLDRESHGWMAWVEPAGCADSDALRRFYRRQGGYLALFYALEATDIHMSNIIAAGEHPMLIDLEALFHPRDAAEEWPALELALEEQAYYSVLRPGLLPEPETGDNEALEPLDLSGLAGRGGQLTPYDVPTWQDRQTDTLHLAAERKLIKGGLNLATLRGRAVDAVDYRADLEAGFCDAYRLLAGHKDALLAPNGLLASFAGVEVRVLPRSGQAYGDLLDAGYHPDLLRDPAARAGYFDKRLRRDALDQPELEQLVAHEVAALVAGDTPLFVSAAGSRDIVTGHGATISDFFPLSGLEMARRRIAALDEADLAQQRWYIRAALATVAQPSNPARHTSPLPEEALSDLPRQALNEALAIGEWLARTAVAAGDELSWIGLQPDARGRWFIEPLGDDLANGLPGVSLFLAQLAAQTGEERWQHMAGAALNTWRRHLSEDRADDDEPEEISAAFRLVSDRLMALAHLAASWPGLRAEIPLLIAQAERLLDDLQYRNEDKPGKELSDLLSALLAAPEGAGQATAARVAGRLLSHGSATETAIAPLFALAAMTGEGRYRAAAEALLPTLLDGDPVDPHLWRTYLAARPWLNELQRAAPDRALRQALPELAAQGMGVNHSLWYGDMGTLDLLLSAAVLDDPALDRLAQRYGAAVVAGIHRHGPMPGTPLAVESPGLAVGLAGIGYGLLRLADPQTTRPLPFPATQREAV